MGLLVGDLPYPSLKALLGEKTFLSARSGQNRPSLVDFDPDVLRQIANLTYLYLTDACRDGNLAEIEKARRDLNREVT